MYGTPEGVVGKPTISNPDKGKRPMVAICRLLSLLIEQILETFPAGKVPIKGFTMRSLEELDPYLKEPLSPGWKSVYSLPRVGPVERL